MLTHQDLRLGTVPGAAAAFVAPSRKVLRKNNAVSLTASTNNEGKWVGRLEIWQKNKIQSAETPLCVFVYMQVRRI